MDEDRESTTVSREGACDHKDMAGDSTLVSSEQAYPYAGVVVERRTWCTVCGHVAIEMKLEKPAEFVQLSTATDVDLTGT